MVKAALSGLKTEYKMVINIEVEEDIALDIIRNVEDKWKRIEGMIKKESKEKHERIARTLKEIDDMMDKMIIRSMAMSIKRERALYGDIMNIIRAAEETNRTSDFMKALKTYFKKLDISRLERWAGKLEMLGIKKYLNSLKKDKKDVETKVSRLGKDLGLLDRKAKKKGAGVTIKAEKDFEEVVKKLKLLIQQMEGDISKLFFNAYKAIRRGFMLIFVLLNDLDELRRYVKRWEAIKAEPVDPEEKILKDISKAEENISKNAHVIAQGLRVLYHKANAIAAKAK